MKKQDKLLNALLPFLTVAVIFGLWGLAAAKVDSEYVLPTVGDTFAALWELLKSAEFYRAYFGTLLRSVVAFAIAFFLAFIAAFVAYKYDKAKRALKPLIVIIRALPTIAVVLLLVLWTSSFVAPVIVTFLVVFPTLYNNLYAALCGIDNDLNEMCKVFGVSNKKRLTKVVFPQIAPEFITSAGAGLTLNLKLMVAAEVLAQTARSMGYLLNTSKIYFEISTMLALVLITVITGLIIEFLFSFWAKKAVKR
ncbi:MAG: ABC transporter permease subunit [Clostridia bacterium]|nr:ABC transporter permease subunit [Clostridia bacterium]